MADKREVSIKIPDQVLGGVYANQMMVSHTREEFVLDFINVVPPQAVVTARIATSPGHLKRIIQALNENLVKYEDAYGEIEEAPEPVGDEVN